MPSSRTKAIALREPQCAIGCTTEIGRAFQHGSKHGFNVARRGADDLEDVGGGGLLLEGFAQLVKQARIFNRDDGLRGKCLNEVNLLVSKRTWLSALQSKHTDNSAFTYERNAKSTAYVDYTTIILKPAAVEVWIG